MAEYKSHSRNKNIVNSYAEFHKITSDTGMQHSAAQKCRKYSL